MADICRNHRGDRILRFNENDRSVESNIDTEGYEVWEIEIHGRPAQLAAKEGKSKLVWSEADRFFILTVTEDAETAIKIGMTLTLCAVSRLAAKRINNMETST